MKQKFKYFIFITFIGLLFIPHLVKNLNLIKEKPLGGTWIPIEKPILTDSAWYSGTFQIKKEKYITENIGLHNTLVRINNQIKFSLFDKVNADKVVVGKKKYLFEDNYIYATLGKDYIGDLKIEYLLNNYKQAEAILKKYNIKLLFVFAPGKATFFKEYIPNRFFKEISDKEKIRTNYEELVNGMRKNKIDFIDFNACFLKLKNTSKYPLFPKAGIHWSYYGMYIAVDSIIKKIEKDINKDIPDLILQDVEVRNEQRDTDYDLGNLINILFPIKTYPLAYPQFKYISENKYRPKVLVIGDSFYWNIFYSGIPSNIFSSLDFYYYNSKYYNDGTNNPKAEVSTLDYLHNILKYEYIIILQTDGGLNNFAFEVPDRIISCNSKDNIPDGVKKHIDAINNDPKWLKHIEDKARQRGISLEEMIFIDANYMYQLELQNEKKIK